MNLYMSYFLMVSVDGPCSLPLSCSQAWVVWLSLTRLMLRREGRGWWREQRPLILPLQREQLFCFCFFFSYFPNEATIFFFGFIKGGGFLLPRSFWDKLGCELRRWCLPARSLRRSDGSSSSSITPTCLKVAWRTKASRATQNRRREEPLPGRLSL